MIFCSLLCYITHFFIIYFIVCSLSFVSLPIDINNFINFLKKVSYYSEDFDARMTSDVPVDFIKEEIFFKLEKKCVIFFGYDEKFIDNMMNVADDFLRLVLILLFILIFCLLLLMVTLYHIYYYYYLYALLIIFYYYYNKISYKKIVIFINNKKTQNYWENFSRELHLPLEWQQEVIRAAITLKMCQYESVKIFF